MADLALWLAVVSLAVSVVSALRLLYSSWNSRPAAELQRRHLDVVRSLACRGYILKLLVDKLTKAQLNRPNDTNLLLMQHLREHSIQAKESIDEAISDGILLPSGLETWSNLSVEVGVNFLGMEAGFALPRGRNNAADNAAGGWDWYIELSQMLTNAIYPLANLGREDKYNVALWAVSKSIWLDKAFRTNLVQLLAECKRVLDDSPFTMDRATAEWVTRSEDGRAIHREVTKGVSLPIGSYAVTVGRS